MFQLKLLCQKESTFFRMATLVLSGSFQILFHAIWSLCQISKSETTCFQFVSTPVPKIGGSLCCLSSELCCSPSSYICFRFLKLKHMFMPHLKVSFEPPILSSRSQKKPAHLALIHSAQTKTFQALRESPHTLEHCAHVCACMDLCYRGVRALEPHAFLDLCNWLGFFCQVINRVTGLINNCF